MNNIIQNCGLPSHCRIGSREVCQSIPCGQTPPPTLPKLPDEIDVPCLRCDDKESVFPWWYILIAFILVFFCTILSLLYYICSNENRRAIRGRCRTLLHSCGPFHCC